MRRIDLPYIPNRLPRSRSLMYGRSRRISARKAADTAVLQFGTVSGEPWKLSPNASCVVSMVDRLIHRAEILQIDAKSWRAKEARERNAAKQNPRSKKKTAGNKS